MDSKIWTGPIGKKPFRDIDRILTEDEKQIEFSEEDLRPSDEQVLGILRKNYTEENPEGLTREELIKRAEELESPVKGKSVSDSLRELRIRKYIRKKIVIDYPKQPFYFLTDAYVHSSGLDTLYEERRILVRIT